MELYRVLLVDDEEDIREGISRKMDWLGLGFSLVGEAANGQDALELAESLRPDVILTDIKMPFMDGLELCRILTDRLPAARFVVFSGFDAFEYAKQAIQMNVVEYILKPINADELSAVLRRLKDQLDRERAERCLRAAGLGEKLDALPHGMDTHLDKQVNPDGIELSGGEAQKLMMARALYKDAPVLVLDEPTAALDPIAENEVYEQYRRMAAGKTSLFISHRLASTRFCDRIVLLRDGGIAEEGTHETLLAAGGEYARLYEIQSCWYQPGYQGGEQA